MHVTLLNAPWYFQKKLEFLSQNLGLGYVAAHLRQQGHTVEIIDAVAEAPDTVVDVQAKYERVKRFGLPYEDLASRIRPDTDWIGIGVPFSHNRTIYKEVVAVIKKRLPGVPLVAGGMYPSTDPYDAMDSAADYVITGEGELPMAELVSGVPPERIQGLLYRDGNGEVRCNPGRRGIKDMDQVPMPARDIMPMERYLTLSARGLEGRRTAAMITSRGCPFECTFCSIHPVYGRLFRRSSVDRVYQEIVSLVENFDIDHIEFEDDNLTLNIQRAEGIMDAILDIRNSLKPITWEDPNGIRIDTLTKPFMQKAKESGCRRLYLALEHGDEETRNVIMKKKLKEDAVLRVTREAAEVGIPTLFFTIVGHPGETRERFERGVAFCQRLRELGAERFEVFVAKPYPGSPLLELCREEGYLKYPDVENLVFNMDTVAIETPDFDAAEVLRRRRVALATLNPFIYRFKEPLQRVFPRRWLRRAKAALGVS